MGHSIGQAAEPGEEEEQWISSFSVMIIFRCPIECYNCHLAWFGNSHASPCFFISSLSPSCSLFIDRIGHSSRMAIGKGHSRHSFWTGNPAWRHPKQYNEFITPNYTVIGWHRRMVAIVVWFSWAINGEEEEELAE